jgi:hypothetical protein
MIIMVFNLRKGKIINSILKNRGLFKAKALIEIKLFDDKTDTNQIVFDAQKRAETSCIWWKKFHSSILLQRETKFCN